MRSICTFVSTSEAPDVAPSRKRFGDISRVAIEIQTFGSPTTQFLLRFNAARFRFIIIALLSIPTDHSVSQERQEVASNVFTPRDYRVQSRRARMNSSKRIAAAIFRFCQDAIALIANKANRDSFTRAAKIHTSKQTAQRGMG